MNHDLEVGAVSKSGGFHPVNIRGKLVANSTDIMGGTNNEHGWKLAGKSIESKIQQQSLNPTVA